MDLIDSRIEDGMDRSDIEESLIGDMMDETPFHFCMSYALWKLESDREKEFDTLLEQKVAEMSSGNDSDSGTAPEDPAPLSPQEIMEIVNGLPGWGNLKKRMEEVITCHATGERRGIMDLKKNLPVMHTILIGNPGTGKSYCVRYLLHLYKSLGMLDSDIIRYTTLTKISNNTVSSEVNCAVGGILVFENAHELYHSENKAIDTEQQIVRSLID